jgi:DNA-binding transcriptional ArsR family regulator
MNNSLRRKILRILNKGKTTFEELGNKTGLDKTTLEWHLSVLENGFCVEKENQKGKLIFKLTQEGKVVNYMK